MNFVQSKTAIKMVAVWALILLSGCAVGPDFKQPVVATPESYRLDTMPVGIAEDLKWWELFDDPVLYTLVTTALENNRDLKIASQPGSSRPVRFWVLPGPISFPRSTFKAEQMEGIFSAPHDRIPPTRPTSSRRR